MEILGSFAPDPAGLGPAPQAADREDAGPVSDPWTDAALVAALVAVDPAGLGGALLKALPGPARDAWLDMLRTLLPEGTPLRRVPLHVTDERLLGGLDLAATLHAGRPVAEKGLLVEADGGVIVLAMAERLTPAFAAKLGMAVDHGAVRVERDGIAALTPTRFGVVALDESVGPDEGPPEALRDRLAFHMELEGLRERDIGEPLHEPEEIVAARDQLARVTIEDRALEALCGAALAMGVVSLRAPLFALRVARAAAALDRRDTVEQDDLTLAARLVLAPRATRIPEMPPPPPPEEDQEEEEPPPPPDEGEDERQQDDDDKPLEDQIVDAAQAAIPANLLARLMAAAGRKRRTGILGRSGEQRKALTRGRPIGSRRGDPRAGARLALIDTLRSAAPWQPLRRAEMAQWAEHRGDDRPLPRVLVRKDDFRITRFKKRSQATIIFVVDASGSSAIARLGEAKGAIELLLADCYARRDQVALVAFRGKGAEALLPPTRSLARAKKRLAGFPGGGGTPLAAGIEAAHMMAEVCRTRGETPSVVILTDGRANVTLEGIGGRAKAEEDAKAAAEGLRAMGVSTLLVDTSLRPAAKAQALADSMGATYMPLPRADARALSVAARSAAQTADA
ncbi:magnesium chelatase subunit D [Roseospira marina]|uniref:Mg-protoporphyrin IX chelatase n=1 Tax=Roseospira marina TaxID=140057 RepID=A0A5M6I960_9PROT|nr:magnesium chelatase subunit D [Roseospira marina]KAA5604806.1 magnesium chelatase subunit D [Roseospira marina]MBB4313497.1 magnesium chelatase subunit D [Roseospira marina]MBB5086659.1 magnesium chelatase subunit D [Roseospira marina]